MTLSAKCIFRVGLWVKSLSLQLHLVSKGRSWGQELCQCPPQQGTATLCVGWMS